VQRALALLGRLGIKRAGAMAEAASFIVESFGDFDFSGISLKLPTQTFDKQLTLQVGAKTVELIEVGPAHTKGDVIVHVPEQRIAYTGDILFIGSHPIIWEGPVGNWIAACDRLLALDVDVIVPGHGPITNKQGVATTRAYFQRLVEVTQQGRAAGQSAQAIAAELRAQHFDDWGEAHRLAVNVDTIYREQAHDRSARDPLTMLAAMARWDRLPA
jgi:glyoxylase-like metal-dependent hydrolase (beta-lactamase superfamily II)